MILVGVALFAFWPFDCNSNYCTALDESRKHEQIAISIVAHTPDAINQKRIRYGASWLVAGSIEGADKNFPFYCPNEYFVALGDDDSAPRWIVSLRTREVHRLRSIAEIMSSLKAASSDQLTSNDDGRLQPCLDGRPPAALDPHTLPDEANNDPHPPSD